MTIKKARFNLITSIAFVLVLLMFGIQNAQARLYVEIAGGGTNGLPIAVVPFAGNGPQGMTEISDIIKADLKTSGLFKTIPPQGGKNPSQPSEVNAEFWHSIGADNVVIGRVQNVGSNYTVCFELMDVVKQNSNASQSTLLSLRYDNVTPNEFRALAHHISDRIFERLIGMKGFFSTRIAYISVTETPKGTIQTIEVADYDGFNPKPLYRSNSPLLSPSWSPDGKKIAFVSFEKERQSINVVDVMTGKVDRVAQYPGINSAPSWSPDGRTLALVLSKDGGPKIYTLELASQRLTKITEGSGADTEPSFTTDGRSIVFTSDRGGKPQIYQVTLADGRVERLTFKGNYNSTPSLTPDKKNLVTLHRDEDGLFSIAVHTLNSGAVRVLTQSSLNESPRLAPNGMMVIYSALENNRRVLGAVTLDGRLKIRIPSQEGDVKEPAWSPFVN